PDAREFAMSPGPKQLLRHVRQLVSRAEPRLGTDAALLDRFTRLRDEAAFEALVARHGPMILGVCRRVLHDRHEAEDVAQATFLVLARKAPSLRRPDTLAAWLHGVAYRLALKCRRADLRRRGREGRSVSAALVSADPREELTARDFITVLDEEIQRLPEAYRQPLVLCCLEGHTREETAALLGWTPGAVKGRLERGRSRLHARLARRGLTLSAALGVLEATGSTAPAGWARELTEAAMGFARNQGVGSGVSAKVAALAEGGL